MAAKSEVDRRVQKTQQALQEALIALILEKGYDAVMVQDILDRANVGRSTFYAHYRDKEDLLASRFERLQVAFQEHARLALEHDSTGHTEASDHANLPLFVLKYVEHEHRLFKALVGNKGSGRHLPYLRNVFVKYVRDILRTEARTNLSPVQLEIVAQFVTSSFLALLVWWIDNDMPCAAEELYTLMIRLTEPGMKDVLRVSSLWPDPQ